MYFRNKLNRRRIIAVAGMSLLFAASFVLSSTLKHEIVQIEQANEQEEHLDQGEGLSFRRLSLQDANGVIDPDGLRKARQHIQAMKQVQNERRLKRQSQIEEAGIATDSWTWLGPGNIGGRIRSIAIQPGNANNMYVGSVSGGIWRTSNAGGVWFPVNDFMADLAVTTIVINPANNNIMFAGTGEGFTNNPGAFTDTIQGDGIFRSADQGVTWTQLAATNNLDFNTVNRLAISPNGATVLAATATGVFRSTDSGTTWPAAPGFTGDIQDIAFNPSDSSKAIASRPSPPAARYSIDGGLNWPTATFNPALTADPARIELAYAPSNPAIVYASVNQNNGEVYRSTDGGQTYNRVNTGNNLLGGQGSYDNTIWVNPLDSNFVIVGGVALNRSTNAGANFTDISSGCNPSVHADQHAIVAPPTFNNGSNRTVFFANDGGIFRSDNVATVCASSSWTALINNLGITQFYGVDGNQSSGVVMAGAQDNGTSRFTGGTANWTQVDQNDGGYVAADQTDPNYFYGESQNLGVFRSFNGGQGVSLVSNLTLTDRNDGVVHVNFIAPFVIDPNEPTRLLAGGWSLWRTNDARGGSVWNAIKNPSSNSPISAIAISPNNSDFIVVGHNNGDVYLTFNGTAASPTWSKIDTAGLSNNFLTRLTIDVSRSPNWIYATFGGFSPNNVYVTRDLGGSWIDITGTGSTGLPDVPVRTLVYHPVNPNLLYVGTEVGIFTSEDAGATWDLPQDGPANVSVDQLVWMGGDLLAATYGRGAYRASGGLYVDCNYLGTQLGTAPQPFRTVNAALNALPANSYRPIWLQPCNYNETLNTNGKRFEFRNVSGTPKIGAP